MRPDDPRVVALAAAIVALADMLLGERAAPVSYDAANLPPGMTLDAYRRRHRARVHAGTEGWTCVGKARLVTRGAWERDIQAETEAARSRRAHPQREAPSSPSPANDLDARLDAALGIRTRTGR